jgi:hypothetical protein
MRISWIDDDGNSIAFPGLSNEFTMYVKADLSADDDCSTTTFS